MKNQTITSLTSLAHLKLQELQQLVLHQAQTQDLHTRDQLQDQILQEAIQDHQATVHLELKLVLLLDLILQEAIQDPQAQVHQELKLALPLDLTLQEVIADLQAAVLLPEATVVHPAQAPIHLGAAADHPAAVHQEAATAVLQVAAPLEVQAVLQAAAIPLEAPAVLQAVLQAAHLAEVHQEAVEVAALHHVDDNTV